MKFSSCVTAFILIMTTSVVSAEETLDLQNEETRINYSLGYQIGSDFKRQKLNMNPDAVIQGIQDALSGTPSKIPFEEMRMTLIELKRKVVAEERDRLKNRMSELAEQSKTFMVENKKREGVVTTESGLQYRITDPGEGKTPSPTDKVTVNYRGTYVDGQEFDNSTEQGKPSTFGLDRMIKGWFEGLQLIKEGGKITLFVPPELAYGTQGPMANQALIFDIELIAVNQETAEQPSASKSPDATSGKK